MGLQHMAQLSSQEPSGQIRASLDQNDIRRGKTSIGLDVLTITNRRIWYCHKERPRSSIFTEHGKQRYSL